MRFIGLFKARVVCIQAGMQAEKSCTKHSAPPVENTIDFSTSVSHSQMSCIAMPEHGHPEVAFPCSESSVARISNILPQHISGCCDCFVAIVTATCLLWLRENAVWLLCGYGLVCGNGGCCAAVVLSVVLYACV